MNDLRTSGLIGVDGGGTSCRIGLVHLGRRFEVRIKGATNIGTNRTAAIKTIKRGLELVATKAGLMIDDLRQYPAYLGLAGLMLPEDSKQIAACLPLENVQIKDDQETAIVGALGETEGAVAGIGTGSFVVRKSEGHLKLIGGWGLILGDEASGAWLGRGLLSAVLRAADGIGVRSDLTDAVFSEYNNNPGEIAVFSFSAAPRDFAELAPRVVSAAASGDAVAVDLMNSGASYIQRALDVLGWRAGEALYMIGGVARHYADFLCSATSESIAEPKGTALDGALVLASKMNAGQKSP